MTKVTSENCKCEDNFTCGYCLRNVKPYHYTLSDGSAIVGNAPSINTIKNQSEGHDTRRASPESE